MFHQRLKCSVFHISYKILIFYATQSLIDGSYWKKLFSLFLFFSCHEKSILFSQHVRRQTYIIHQCLRNWCCRRLYTLKVFTFHLPWKNGRNKKIKRFVCVYWKRMLFIHMISGRISKTFRWIYFTCQFSLGQYSYDFIWNLIKLWKGAKIL